MKNSNVFYLNHMNEENGHHFAKEMADFKSKMAQFSENLTPEYFGFVGTVVKEIMNGLETDSPISMSGTAERLGMSKKTLARKLCQSGNGYTKLRDCVRKKIAVEELISGKKTHLIAKNLQFCDNSTFSNAFKRWTGYSPQVFKKNCQVYGLPKNAFLHGLQSTIPLDTPSS